MGLTRQNCMKINQKVWNFVAQQRNSPKIRSCGMSFACPWGFSKNAWWWSLHFDKINILLQLSEQKTVVEPAFPGDVPSRRRKCMFWETKWINLCSRGSAFAGNANDDQADNFAQEFPSSLLHFFAREILLMSLQISSFPRINFD